MLPGLESIGLFTTSSEDVKYESCPKSQGLKIYPSPALGNKSKELWKNHSSPTQFQQEELSTPGTQELLKLLLINFYLCQAQVTTDAEYNSNASLPEPAQLPMGRSKERSMLSLPRYLHADWLMDTQHAPPWGSTRRDTFMSDPIVRRGLKDQSISSWEMVAWRNLLQAVL